MEALGILVALAVIVIFAVQVFRHGSKPPTNPPLDQSWQKQPRRTASPTPRHRPVERTPPPRTMPTDSKPSPAGTAYQRGQTVAAFNAETARALQRTLKGRAYVIDGDSLKIQNTQVRIFGVDAPEMNHPYGKIAKSAMIKLCKGQIITAEVTDVDDHGRTVAKCTLADGRDLSAELVKQGLALDWPKYSGGIYSALETPDARKKLWLAAARQRGHMHVWDQFDAREKAKKGG